MDVSRKARKPRDVWSATTEVGRQKRIRILTQRREYMVECPRAFAASSSESYHRDDVLTDRFNASSAAMIGFQVLTVDLYRLRLRDLRSEYLRHCRWRARHVLPASAATDAPLSSSTASSRPRAEDRDEDVEALAEEQEALAEPPHGFELMELVFAEARQGIEGISETGLADKAPAGALSGMRQTSQRSTSSTVSSPGSRRRGSREDAVAKAIVALAGVLGTASGPQAMPPPPVCTMAGCKCTVTRSEMIQARELFVNDGVCAGCRHPVFEHPR
jgi:hypothetical protein